MPVQVYKFGGVAVGSPEALRSAAAHVKRAAPNVAAVVSAANGVTDLLLDAGHAALRGDRVAYITASKKFEMRHNELIDAVIVNRARAEELRNVIADAAHEMRSMAESISVLRELTTRATDALVARGERVLAQIFTALLNDGGVQAEFVDAHHVILTERRLGSLWPNFLRCERAAKKTVTPILEAGRVVVMPGYLASRSRRRSRDVRPRRNGFLGGDPRAQHQRERGHAVQGGRRPHDRRSEERPLRAPPRRAALPRSGGARVLRREGAAPADDDPARRSQDPAVRAQHLPRQRRHAHLRRREAGRVSGEGVDRDSPPGADLHRRLGHDRRAGRRRPRVHRALAGGAFGVDDQPGLERVEHLLRRAGVRSESRRRRARRSLPARAQIETDRSRARGARDRA